MKEKKKSVDEKVIGLTLDEAKKIWDDIRVVEVDGHKKIVTRDYVLMRMNVGIRNGKIVKFFNFG
jgi:hypothetical protein